MFFEGLANVDNKKGEIREGKEALKTLVSRVGVLGNVVGREGCFQRYKFSIY